MKERFEEKNGKRILIETLKRQKTVNGDEALALHISESIEIIEIPEGTVLTTQGESSNDVYFILMGAFQIIVNGKHLYNRFADDLIGEMTAIQPTQLRSATVISNEISVVAKMTEENFSEIGSKYPIFYKSIAQILAKRLLQRNSLIPKKNQKPRVFIICSVEALPVGRLVQELLEYDGVIVTLWSEGVFRVTNYTLHSLEEKVEESDFAIAIANGDDIVNSRDLIWPAVRDNVIFELGLFMGRLGRERAILMEPKDEKVKLPSDLCGITTIGYRYVPGKDEESIMGATVNKIRKHIKEHGLR